MPATMNHPQPPRFSRSGKRDGWGFFQRWNRSLLNQVRNKYATGEAGSSLALIWNRWQQAAVMGCAQCHIRQRQNHPAPTASRIEFPLWSHRSEHANHARRPKRRWMSGTNRGILSPHENTCMNWLTLFLPYFVNFCKGTFFLSPFQLFKRKFSPGN